MSLTPNFSGSQSLAYNNLITLTDTSTGSDNTITTRRVYIRTAQNTYLTTSGESTTSAYDSWNYADSSIQLNVLTASTAPEITVEWYAGSTLTYTKTIAFDFNLYDYVFAIGKLSDQTGNPLVLGDTNYYQSFIQFIVNLTNSENAITYASDIYSAQGALNQNQQMINNESFYF
jgi:hypothetical protein